MHTNKHLSLYAVSVGTCVGLSFLMLALTRGPTGISVSGEIAMCIRAVMLAYPDYIAMMMTTMRGNPAYHAFVTALCSIPYYAILCIPLLGVRRDSRAIRFLSIIMALVFVGIHLGFGILMALAYLTMD